jgi:hypothetical protein
VLDVPDLLTEDRVCVSVGWRPRERVEVRREELRDDGLMRGFLELADHLA